MAAGVDALGDEHVDAVAEGLARGGHVADLHKDLEAAVVAGRDDVGVGAALLCRSRVRGEEPDGLGDLWDGKLLICGGQRRGGRGREDSTVFLKKRDHGLSKARHGRVVRDQGHADGDGGEGQVGEAEHGAGVLEVLLQAGEAIGPGVEVESRRGKAFCLFLNFQQSNIRYT